MHWMVENIRNFEYSASLAQHLQNGQMLMVVSDGLYRPDFKIGTAAWVIKHSGDNEALTGDNLVPGDANSQCSHCSKLTGIIGAVQHMNLLCQRYKIQQGNIELGCDGLEAYKVASQYVYDPTTQLKHFDLVSTLHQLIDMSQLKWKF